jgi:hypothetical protein
LPEHEEEQRCLNSSILEQINNKMGEHRDRYFIGRIKLNAWNEKEQRNKNQCNKIAD